MSCSAGAPVRIAVKRDFRLDRFGPRGPLLRAKSPGGREDAGGSSENSRPAEGGGAQPVPSAAPGGDAAGTGAAGSPSESTTMTPAGWCTFDGCFELFSTWEEHVNHHRACHRDRVEPRDRRSFCPICLVKVAKYEAHMTSHRRSRWLWDCAACSATFAVHEGLWRHWSQFHCSSPPDSTLTPRPAASAAASAGRRNAANEMSATTSAPPHSRRTRHHKDIIGWCTEPYCLEPFWTWADHVQHHLKTHPLKSSLSTTGFSMCYLCLETCARDGHMREHRAGDVACSLCSARFIGSLSKHMQQFHRVTANGRVPAALGRCTRRHCNASFVSWDDQVQHFLACHWSDKDSARVCPLCLECSLDLRQASDHAKKHRSYDVYACEKCPARFVKAKGLSGHLLDFHYSS